MEDKSSAKESSEPNDDEDTKDEVDNKDEGDKDEDDELETQLESRTLSLYLTFQQSGLRETRSYLTKSKEKLRWRPSLTSFRLEPNFKMLSSTS